MHWVSPNCCIALGDVRAIGLDGEDYEWTNLCVGEFRDGLLASVRQFELDDEEAAFAYAESLVTPRTSRLAVSNRASQSVDAMCLAMQAHDVDRCIAVVSDRFVYDDRRRHSGDPIESSAAMRAAVERLLEHYTHFEWRTLAVRGDCLALAWSRWWDDAGNEATYFAVFEVGEDGLITHHVRFDEDDFDGAYRELEHRYYAGEGAAFAQTGHVMTDFIEAMNLLDVDAARRLSLPEFRWLAPPSTLTQEDRSIDEAFRWFQERARQVSSVKNFCSGVLWLSPTCLIDRGETRAIGTDGEDYEWSRIFVVEFRDGRLASVCQFDDDEKAAFAYAETLVTPQPSRLAVTNWASEAIEASWLTMQANDVDALVEGYSEHFVYDDRRRLSGDPITDRTEMRSAFERVLEQFTVFEGHTLAVRGDRSALTWVRWSDAAGNQTAGLFVFEGGEDRRTIYAGRFDEDDFDGAYRELEHRYYAGEGSTLALNGHAMVDFIEAMDRLDIDAAHRLSLPDFRWLAPPSTLTQEARSVDDVFRWLEARTHQVSSVNNFFPVARWLSPTCVIGRGDVLAVGPDGEEYKWSRIFVVEFRDGRLASVCQFDDDEEAAFAYADTLVTPRPTRLALTNRATETMDRAVAAMRARDARTTVDLYADPFTYDDRRRLSGDPIVDHDQLLAAAEHILAQYTHFEERTLAVRGERMQLCYHRWSDDNGNEATQLRLIEVDGGGLIAYEGRFDGDDFEGAYRELEHRYYSGEGAAYAESGATVAAIVTAHNRGDLETVFGELTDPQFRIENRSRSAFPDRSAAELRASTEELQAMFISVRMWYSAVSWLSSNWAVARQDREAVGPDGENYQWMQLYVSEIRRGLVTSTCAFDVEDEDAAFAYAEERMRATSNRLAVTNRASELIHGLFPAFEAGDADAIDAVVEAYADQFVFDDRRRLSGDPIVDRAEMRAATERILDQFSVFDTRTLAVRGERMALVWSRWADDSGNETTFLHVFELDDDGRIAYNGRFDEDDFEGAYRELERRYYAGEGAAFAENGLAASDSTIAINRGDFDRLFGEFSTPDMYVENRSRSAFPDRSASDLRTSFADLESLVASARTWMSALCWLSPTWSITRLEREAVGKDGELYSWTRLIATEHRDGRFASMCEFDLEDEEAAFAYAEERMRAASSRLAVTNRSCESVEAGWLAMRAHDVDAAVAFYSDRFEYDDRRRLSGGPRDTPAALRAAVERLLEQYPHFEWRTLAVRGERLGLHWSRWWDDAGNEAAHLHVFEIGDDGRITYDGRFEEDDFESAYRELERRYYAAEGVAYADAGTVPTEVTIALNRGDLDRVFGELLAPEMRFEIRSRSAFPDRSAAELRASLEDLNSWVVSMRSWHSVMNWVSTNCCVTRNEREAVGPGGEKYEWTSLFVTEFRNGRAVASCEFELEDEEEAFAYAEERVRTASSRLAVTNRASEVAESLSTAMQAREVVAAVAAYSDRFVYDDRRRLSGDPIADRPGMRTAAERVFEQFTDFEGAHWQCGASAWHWSKSLVGRRRERDDHTPCVRDSATTGGSPIRAASTKTTSRVPTGNSNAATTPVRARRSRRRVRCQPAGSLR